MGAESQRIPPWSGPRVSRIVAEQKARHAQLRSACCLCQQPIDYTLPDDHPMRFSVEHIIARAVRPDLTWDPSNWGPAHMRCNKSKQTKTLPPVGVTSRQW